MMRLGSRILRRATGYLTEPAKRYSFWSLSRKFQGGFHPMEIARQSALEFAIMNQTGGDYLEFGVFRGHSLMHTVLYSQFLLKVYESKYHLFDWMDSVEDFRGMRFFAFDSFSGMPESSAYDHFENETNQLRRGALSCSVEEFRSNLKRNRIDTTNVVAVPGFFEDSLNNETKRRYNLKKAAIVHVDCDFYEPAGLVLDFVTDLLVDGSIIIFDDWWLFRGHPAHGEQRAVDEWLTRNPTIKLQEFIRSMSVSFVVHRAE